MSGSVEENMIYEAAPDIEVVLRIKKPNPGVTNADNEILSETEYEVTEHEANINISRTISELKQSLGKLLDVNPKNLRVFKDKTEMQDARQIMDYEVETDDILTVYTK